MSDELIISEDFEQYDDETELRRLMRAVKLSQKHFLYFVCCNQVPKQNELIAAVKKEFKGKKIRVIQFKKPVTDLLSELQKKKIAHDCEAVFVQGLERSISSDGKGAENALIYNLNISRDSFKKHLSCPLFLWLPEYAIVKITRHASDFFSVRSGIFYFSNPSEQIVAQAFQNFSLSWVEISSLPVAEKLKQIGSLESLLAEYRGLHTEKQDKRVEGRLLMKLSSLFNSISEHRKALEHLELALFLFRELKDKLSESSALGNLSIVARRLGDIDKSIRYQEQSLIISREINNQVSEAHSLGDLGNIYSSLGEKQKAVDFYEKALSIYRRINDREGISITSGNLGNFYNGIGLYKNAVDYYEQSLKISREIGDYLSEGVNLGNLGSVYYNLGEYRKAIDYYESSVKISNKLGNRFNEGANLNNMAIAYDALGEREKSCELSKQALNIYEAIESPNAYVVRQWIEENCES